jgi:hypothetical protein
MNCRTIFAVAGLLFGLTAKQLKAQADGSSDPLAPPRAKLLCHNLAHSPADTGIAYATALRFEEANDLADSRTIDAAYDSSGTPVYLSVLANRVGSSGEAVTSALVARFGAGGSAAGFRMRTSLKSDSTASTPKGPGLDSRAKAIEPMSIAETSQARALALRLWSHRCPRETGGSSPDR